MTRKFCSWWWMWCFTCVLGMLTSGAAQAAPDYRFKGQGAPAALTFGPAVLNDGERAFIAGLPEIRVAVQYAGAPPYYTVSADGEVAGYQAELLLHLATALGLRVRPVMFDDWPSLLRSVSNGQADMVLTLALTAERLRSIAFSLGTVQVPSALLGLRGNTVPVAEARIALERDYASNDLVRRRYPRATVVPTDTTAQALLAVAQGRADYYVGQLLEAMDTLQKQPQAGIEVRELVQIGAGQYHFGVRKDWALLATILSKGIARFRPELQAPGLGNTTSLPPGGLALPANFVASEAESMRLAQHPVWRIGAVRGLAMLNDIDADGAHSGIAAEYAEHVSRRLGVGLEVVGFESVAQMMDGLRQGRIDFIPFLARTPERERDLRFSNPYFEMPFVLVARSNAPMYWDLNSLRGRRLALALQHPLREVLAQRFPDIQVVDAANGTEAIEMAARGQADAAVEVKIFANLRVNSDSGGQLRTLGEIKEVPARFAFASAAAMADLLPLVSRALAEMPATETERLYRRWVAIDLDPPFPWRRYLPTALVALTALLLVLAGTLWWMRRMAREVRARRRSEEVLQDIGQALPGVTFRYEMGPQQAIARSFISAGSNVFLGLQPRPGQTVFDLVVCGLAPDVARAAREMTERCRASGEPFHFRSNYQHPDGRHLWLYTHAVQSTNQEGQTVWTGYVVDLSSEHALQEKLAQQAAHDAAERHLLLASASHELRAPTHTLSLALQSISATASPEASGKALRIAREAASSLTLLLDDVLDVARFQAGRMQLLPQDFDLKTLVQQVHDAHAMALASKGLHFEVVLSPGVPRLVRLDPMRLKQVLNNLLSNATKYTQSGGVALRVGCGPNPDGAGGLVFEVQDSGQGLDPAQQARLFEPFGSVPTQVGSSGLGLSICRRLVGLMNGTLRLESRLGHGSRFVVWLPLAQQPGDGRALKTEGAVLVCDDDTVCRMLMAEALARSGHSVLEVSDGQAALERWRSGGVRLLITDLTMPGLDGQQLIQAVRAEEKPGEPQTAIVVCSGTPAAAQDTGAGRPIEAPDYDAFLAKPLDLNLLEQTLLALGFGLSPASATSE